MSGPRLFVGLMSGTSLDCVDAVIARFDGPHVQLAFSNSTPIDQNLRSRVLFLAEGASVTLEELGWVDRALGTLFAQATNDLLDLAGLRASDITAIGSHGQTIRHRPCSADNATGFTIQIGDPNTIAELTGICTVADLRRRDVAAGGQGAPLVPAFHQAVFGKGGVDRVIANVGGMANVSLLGRHGDVARGFDTGPGNVLLDAWIFRHMQALYDEDGRWAEAGSVDAGLLHCLKGHPFIGHPPPKSTGREDFNIRWLDRVLEGMGREFDPQDVQATLMEFTAQTLSEGMLSAMPECSEVFVCGGGAKNLALMRRLSTLLGARRVSSTNELGIHPDWVEACAFAWLAHQAIEGLPGNLPSVTGARRPVVLGGVYPGTAGFRRS